MSVIYLLLFIMLMGAVSILAAPFILYKRINSLIFLVLLLSLFSFTLYHNSGNHTKLSLWLAQGQKHYFLLETFEKLGGVEGAILRIQAKLKENPQDAQGWRILGKLYLSQNDDENARAAFARADEINPLKE